MPDIALLATLLDTAARVGLSVSPLAVRHGLSDGDAYAVQAAVVERRLALGERIVGLKMGFTSEAMRRQMGVDGPNCGWLTDAMMLAPGAPLVLSGHIHPRVEPEVAVRLGRDLDGTADEATVAAAVAAVAPAIEVVDSRFHDYRFHWRDNVADNSSSSAFAVGPWREPPVEVGGLAVTLAIDGAVVENGGTDAVMGHPLRALAAAARLAEAAGRPLRAGMVVLTGGITAAPYVKDGQRVTAGFGNLGEVVLDVIA